MKMINLTPHKISIVVSDGTIEIPPSGQVARCAAVQTAAGDANGIPLVRQVFGQVESLPEQEQGTIFIVSALVRAAESTRPDLASPGDLVRDSAGAVVGCRNLIIN